MTAYLAISLFVYGYSAYLNMGKMDRTSRIALVLGAGVTLWTAALLFDRLANGAC